ncbi:MAG: hypothetical protein JO099_18485 [Acidobacteriia bacterium]|nr:hypothetical protein [Terriglobia bacterium]
MTSISEVAGIEGSHVQMQDIFVLERSALGSRGQVLGRFLATGVRPVCLERIKAYGIHLPASIFAGEQALKEA